jgi:enolase
MGILLEYETVLDSDYKRNIMGLRDPKTLQTTLHKQIEIFHARTSTLRKRKQNSGSGDESCKKQRLKQEATFP